MHSKMLINLFSEFYASEFRRMLVDPLFLGTFHSCVESAISTSHVLIFKQSIYFTTTPQQQNHPGRVRRINIFPSLFFPAAG